MDLINAREGTFSGAVPIDHLKFWEPAIVAINRLRRIRESRLKQTRFIDCIIIGKAYKPGAKGHFVDRDISTIITSCLYPCRFLQITLPYGIYFEAALLALSISDSSSS